MVIESFVNDTSTHFHFYIFSKDDSLGLNRNSPFAEKIVQQQFVELGEYMVAGIASYICTSAGIASYILISAVLASQNFISAVIASYNFISAVIGS